MKTEKLNKMTPQEAIRELSYDNTAYSGKCTKEVRETAINALEKQIPKNCKRIGATQLKCICGAVIRLHRYCPYCGQKLDWSE